MTKRPHISVKTKVDVAIRQCYAGSILCPLCDDWLDVDHARILEHLVPHELGGSSDAENLRWVHKECAAKKTNGNKATSAGGDIHKIAKGKRLEKARAVHQAVMSGEREKEPGSIPSRPFPGSRKFDGTPVWRNK
jgi:hypothetical protein